MAVLPSCHTLEYGKRQFSTGLVTDAVHCSSSFRLACFISNNRINHGTVRNIVIL